MAQPQVAPKSQNARDRLKAYYGLQPPAKMELTSENFDAKEYLSQLYRQSSLPQLIQTDNKCLTEIKTLDSDRKNLVYENYSRFIHASESISSIKDNIQDISSELRSAAASVDGITQSLETVGAGLHENKAKLDLIYRKDAMLKKIQFMLELPRRLSQHITAGRYADAVRQYSYTSSLLEKYRHLSIFVNIEKECHSIMQEAERSLWDQVKDKARPIKEIVELSGIILQLKKESTSEVFQALEESCFPKLQEILDHHSNAFKTRDFLTFDALENFKELHRAFLPGFAQLVAGFGQIFQDSLDNEDHAREFSRIHSAFYQKAGALFDEGYIQLIVQYTEFPWKEFSPANLAAATAKLTLWLEELSTYSELSGQGAPVNFMQRARLCICDWEKRLTEGAFVDVLEGFERKLKESYPASYPVDDPTTLQSALLVGKNWLLDMLLNKIQPNLELLLSSDLGFWQLSGTWGFFFRHLQTSFRGLWEALLVLPDPASLLSARLLLDLHHNVLQAVYDAYVGGLIRGLAIPYTHQPSQSDVADDWMEDLFQLQDKAQSCCQDFLRSHTLEIGDRFSQRIISHIASWDGLSCPEPTSASPPFRELVKDLLGLEANIRVLFPPKHDSELFLDSASPNSEMRSPERRSFQALYHSPRQAASPLRSSFSTGGPIGSLPGLHRKLSAVVPHVNEAAHKQWQARIDRLFSERIEVFGNVAYSLEGVLASVVKIILKASVEAIRNSVFGTHGFQQLQVDFEFLSQNLPPSIASELAISSLIDEAGISGAKRCCLPKYMEPEVLSSIAGKPPR